MKNIQNYEEFLNEGVKGVISTILPSKDDSQPEINLYISDINGVKTARVTPSTFFDDKLIVDKISSNAQAKEFLTILRNNLKTAWEKSLKEYSK